jgi:hypothetical protein
MHKVKLWDRSNWRPNSSVFSEERKICVPLQSNGVCLGVVKYLVIFQKEGVWGCNVRRKEFHFVLFSCWSLICGCTMLR